MSNECDFTKCPMYDQTHGVHKEMKELKESDISQSSSLKALHKRMDEDSLIRAETHDAVLEQKRDLKNYVDGEKNKISAKKYRGTIYMWIGGFLFIAVMSITTFLFSTVLSNSISSLGTKKDISTLDTTIKTFVTEQRELNDKMEHHLRTSDTFHAEIQNEMKHLEKNNNFLERYLEKDYRESSKKITE